MFTLHVALYFLSSVLFVTGAVTWWREKRLESLRHFDIPIRDAVIHAANSTDHSYGSPVLRDQRAFERLHQDMCDGKLLVVGREGEFGTLMRIGKRKSRKLSPLEIVVPKNPSTPEGVRYCLVDKAEESPAEQFREMAFRGFMGLRVRSQDLYKHWPKIKAT